MVNVEVQRAEETPQDISIELLLNIAKEYACNDNEEVITDTTVNEDSIDEEILDITEETKTFDIETNDFTLLQSILIVAESCSKDNIDPLLSKMIDNIVGEDFVYDNVYCIDPEDNAVLNLANKHIRGIDEGLNFLQSIGSKPNNGEQYIFINEALYYFYKSPDLFVNEFQRISSIPNIHIYCTTTRPELLNELFCSLFENRASFFLTSTRASKILFGSNAGVSTFDGEITISRDFGQTSTTNVIQIG